MPSALPLELREAAIAYAAEHGVTASAKEYGVSKGSVSSWCRDAGVQTVQNEQTRNATEAAQAKREALREQIKTELLVNALGMLEHMREPQTVSMRRGTTETTIEYEHASPEACRNYAVSAAVLIDKSELLGGGATSRHDLRGAREGVLADARDHGLKLVNGN